MVARIAYWIPSGASESVLEAPATARLHRVLPVRAADPADTLMVQKHPQGGQLLVWPRYDGAAVALEEFAAPRATPEGWSYYPSKEAFDLVTLIKPEVERGDGAWITTAKGIDLWIAVASASQRDLILRANGTIDAGELSTEFGRLGHDLSEQYFSKTGITEIARMGRLVQLALQQAYWVTEEMIEDVSPAWFELKRDLGLMMHTIMGLDPKDFAVVPEPSASSTPAAV